MSFLFQVLHFFPFLSQNVFCPNKSMYMDTFEFTGIFIKWSTMLTGNDYKAACCVINVSVTTTGHSPAGRDSSPTEKGRLWKPRVLKLLCQKQKSEK